MRGVRFDLFALELCMASMDQFFLPNEDPKKYRGPLPNDKDALLQLARGLAHIHKLNGIHFDLKPGNVLLSTGYSDSSKIVLKWADFGFSRILVKPFNDDDMDTNRIGTLNYMAPELLNLFEINRPLLENELDFKLSDVFSCGLVFFYFLTCGMHAFAGDNNNVIYLNIIRGNHPNLTGKLNIYEIYMNIIV